MEELSNLLMSRIILKETEKRKKLLEEELQRIEQKKEAKRKYCNHDIVLYYGEQHEPVFECLTCGEVDFGFSNNNIDINKKVQFLMENGTKVIDVSKYMKIINRKRLLNLIEMELLENINNQTINFETVVSNVEVKIKNKIRVKFDNRI